MQFSDISDRIRELWDSFDLDQWLSDLGITYSLPVQAALCFGSGFAIGFLFKKYFKFLISSLLFAIFLVKFFEYNGIIHIDWVGLRVFLGFAPDANANAMVNTMFDWIKINIVVFLSSLIGFLLGYKLG